ncbi:thymidine kinase [Sphingobacterium mizutaii NBRC 14946 = DSM 11724]|uniref:Thymidine kinase n=3 Tax=Sphingobacteriaceae TaxID=84566 RepID=A0AAJ5C174_9SPHI|nr:thymidine kinase [Sphingobacterium mizutaii NBRC 14946 = DSM 11724]SDL30286.1 thymidine kinase [Sphingobacterium mizutaii]SNV54221.1 Thymidine kinase [Sphingobacterium mizutaii]
MMLFSEHNFPHRRGPIGSIEVICGSMFSGKTEELIRRMKRAQFAKLPVEIFKPEIDVRYGLNEVVSHDSNSIPSTPVSHSSAILLLSADTKVVGIDEAQFFDEELPNVCVELANRGIRVIVAGLDMDYLGKPFGPIPSLMAIAEDVTKVHAVCVKCGAPANYSYRLQQNESRVLLGEKESYEPRCRACYFGLDRQ